MNITTYLAIALASVYCDALLCYAMRVRFSLFGSLFFSLLWPLTVPILIFRVAYVTRNDPSPSIFRR